MDANHRWSPADEVEVYLPEASSLAPPHHITVSAPNLILIGRTKNFDDRSNGRVYISYIFQTVYKLTGIFDDHVIYHAHPQST